MPLSNTHYNKSCPKAEHEEEFCRYGVGFVWISDAGVVTEETTVERYTIDKQVQHR